jgi:hypothetical protein
MEVLVHPSVNGVVFGAKQVFLCRKKCALYEGDALIPIMDMESSDLNVSSQCGPSEHLILNLSPSLEPRCGLVENRKRINFLFNIFYYFFVTFLPLRAIQ